LLELVKKQQNQRQQQIPFGDDNQKGKRNNETQRQPQKQPQKQGFGGGTMVDVWCLGG
jgi:hypothetical protein